MTNLTLVDSLKHIALSGCLLVICTTVFALEPDTVEHWVGSVESIKAWSSEEDQDINREIRALNEPRDVDFERVWSREFMSHPGVAEIRAAHGLSDDDEWNRISSHVLKAWLSLHMHTTLIPEAEAAMAENRTMIENRSDITADRKSEWLAQMDERLERLRKLARRAPREDIEALKPYYERLISIFEAE